MTDHISAKPPSPTTTTAMLVPALTTVVSGTTNGVEAATESDLVPHAPAASHIQASTGGHHHRQLHLPAIRSDSYPAGALEAPADSQPPSPSPATGSAGSAASTSVVRASSSRPSTYRVRQVTRLAKCRLSSQVQLALDMIWEAVRPAPGTAPGADEAHVTRATFMHVFNRAHRWLEPSRHAKVTEVIISKSWEHYTQGAATLDRDAFLDSLFDLASTRSASGWDESRFTSFLTDLLHYLQSQLIASIPGTESDLQHEPDHSSPLRRASAHRSQDLERRRQEIMVTQLADAADIALRTGGPSPPGSSGPSPANDTADAFAAAPPMLVTEVHRGRHIVDRITSTNACDAIDSTTPHRPSSTHRVVSPDKDVSSSKDPTAPEIPHKPVSVPSPHVQELSKVLGPMWWIAHGYMFETWRTLICAIRDPSMRVPGAALAAFVPTSVTPANTPPRSPTTPSVRFTPLIANSSSPSTPHTGSHFPLLASPSPSSRARRASLPADLLLLSPRNTSPHISPGLPPRPRRASLETSTIVYSIIHPSEM